jgi:NADPH:quinone reductase-like Zn-dependent oxidoreductase
MLAIVRERYGPPEVLQLKEVEKPAPTEGRVLIEVRAASANPLDWHSMRGAPFFARMSDGLSRPKDPRLGTDVAGRVEAIGVGVTRFKPGDEVFGACPGSFAEFASAKEDMLVPKPSNVSFEEAAAVPVAGITALQGLRDRGQVKEGQEVLVNGASGGVGTFAVQIAKSFGAKVTGVCSTGNLELVKSIGADRVMDYTKEDFTRAGLSFDLILDAVGNRSVSDYERALGPQGICVVVGFSGIGGLIAHALLGPLLMTGGKKMAPAWLAKLNRDDLASLAGLLADGKVKPVIDRRYTLGQTPDAIGYLEKGHARGKVVITVEPRQQ